MPPRHGTRSIRMFRLQYPPRSVVVTTVAPAATTRVDAGGTVWRMEGQNTFQALRPLSLARSR